MIVGERTPELKPTGFRALYAAFLGIFS